MFVRFGEYMSKHRVQPDGSVRDSDNWQKGIPLNQYVKSLWRHFLSLWTLHRGYRSDESIEEALCGIIFNASGYLHECLKERNVREDIPLPTTPQTPPWWSKMSPEEREEIFGAMNAAKAAGDERVAQARIAYARRQQGG